MTPLDCIKFIYFYIYIFYFFIGQFKWPLWKELVILRARVSESCKLILKPRCMGMIERNSRQSDVGGKFEQLLKSTEDNGTHNILLLKFIKTRLGPENFWLNER